MVLFLYCVLLNYWLIWGCEKVDQLDIGFDLLLVALIRLCTVSLVSI